MRTTRVFKSGDGQAAATPDDIAFEDGDELTVTRHGDVVDDLAGSRACRHGRNGGQAAGDAQTVQHRNLRAGRISGSRALLTVVFMIDTNITMHDRDGQ